MIDPIVEAVRKAGQTYIDSFNGDFRAIVADLRRRTDDAARDGHRVISGSPKPPRPRAGTFKPRQVS